DLACEMLSAMSDAVGTSGQRPSSLDVLASHGISNSPGSASGANVTAGPPLDPAPSSSWLTLMAVDQGMTEQMAEVEERALARLMVPDALMPGQYYEGVRRDDPATGAIKRLMLAVLEE